jgi:hypothetical protein
MRRVGLLRRGCNLEGGSLIANWEGRLLRPFSLQRSTLFYPTKILIRPALSDRPRCRRERVCLGNEHEFIGRETAFSRTMCPESVQVYTLVIGCLLIGLSRIYGNVVCDMVSSYC